MVVPFTENKNATQITLDLNEKLNVDITEEDISIAHRLPLKQGNSNLKNRRHPPIIVHFLSKHKRNEIFAKRFYAKHISNFPVNQMNHLFINKNLTQRRKNLLWQAKQKVKELNYEYIWTNNGQIFVRKNENEGKILVKTDNDLNKL